MEEDRRFNTILERLQCHREQKHKGHYEQQEKGCAGPGRDARWGRELRYQPRCKQSAEPKRMSQRGPSHPPGAGSQELPGGAAAGGGRAVRRAREHRARLCTERLGWPSAGERLRAPRPRQGRRARVWAAPRLWSRTLPAPRTPSPEPAARAGGGAEAAHGHSAARWPPPGQACGPRPLATVGGGAGRGRTEISLSLSPRGKGEWRRDRLRELQLPCGLRNSRGVCRGDAIMASVLAREAAALRRRGEHLPAPCAPPSAQAP